MRPPGYVAQAAAAWLVAGYAWTWTAPTPPLRLAGLLFSCEVVLWAAAPLLFAWTLHLARETPPATVYREPPSSLTNLGSANTNFTNLSTNPNTNLSTNAHIGGDSVDGDAGRTYDGGGGAAVRARRGGAGRGSTPWLPSRDGDAAEAPAAGETRRVGYWYCAECGGVHARTARRCRICSACVDRAEMHSDLLGACLPAPAAPWYAAATGAAAAWPLLVTLRGVALGPFVPLAAALALALAVLHASWLARAASGLPYEVLLSGGSDRRGHAMQAAAATAAPRRSTLRTIARFLLDSEWCICDEFA
jgi:hypothetical protein